jgi:hypothetical protein
MTTLQINLLGFVLILLLNFVISVLRKKYEAFEDKDAERQTVLIETIPGSFGPRVPFLLLKKESNPKKKKIQTLHNIVCCLVYLLFMGLIFHHVATA